MIEGLFYHEATKNYFMIDQHKTCTYCKNVISKMIILHTYYFKDYYSHKFYCMHCSKHIKDIGRVSSRKAAILTDKPPKTAFPVIDTGQVSLKEAPKNETVFTAAYLESEQTVDKAGALRDPNFMIQDDYKEFDDKESLRKLEQETKPLTDAGFGAIMNRQLESEVLTHDDKKVLTHNKKKRGKNERGKKEDLLEQKNVRKRRTARQKMA